MINQASKPLSVKASFPQLFSGIYCGKRVLVTGHTGFKGSWLSIWLRELGAEVMGFALPPESERDNYVLSGMDEKIRSINCDIRDLKSVIDIFKDFQPEFVFHLAAQSVVRFSYEEPVETFKTNLMGTVNVLEAIRKTGSVRVGVMITSDKCYENKELTRGYKETDQLGGYDPYSASKACCELAISSYRRSFFNPKDYEKHNSSIASVRAGNVIGGGDWKRDRIIPDCIRALERETPIIIRNPNSTRPWQHVLEPLSGYLLLGKLMLEEPVRYCDAWNFGPSAESIITVGELTDLLIKHYGSGSWEKITGSDGAYESTLLALDCSEANKRLNWSPTLDIEETVELTVDWYKRYRDFKDCYELALEEIDIYVKKALKRETF